MNPIVCRQIARYAWKVYVRDDDGKVDIENYRGQVQRVGDDYHAFEAVYHGEFAHLEPRLDLLGPLPFKTLAEAAEAIA